MVYHSYTHTDTHSGFGMLYHSHTYTHTHSELGFCVFGLSRQPLVNSRQSVKLEAKWCITLTPILTPTLNWAFVFLF
jgi:hypothetical protein